MKFISSRDNTLYKEIKHLATSARARRLAQQTLLDGVHLGQVYLQQQQKPLYCVVCESALPHPEIAELAQKCQALDVPCIVLPDALYGALSQVENGVGILLVIAIPQPQEKAALSASSVLLDRLQDPGNVGSILRSAAAAGIRQIFCSSETVSVWSPKVLRAAMGAHFLLEIYENAELEPLMHASTVTMLATSSHALKSLYELDLKQPVAWLFGHEGQGVEEHLMRLATHQIAIPHRGEMESLNVAACAAVCFFEQLRQT